MIQLCSNFRCPTAINHYICADCKKTNPDWQMVQGTYLFAFTPHPSPINPAAERGGGNSAFLKIFT